MSLWAIVLLSFTLCNAQIANTSFGLLSTGNERVFIGLSGGFNDGSFIYMNYGPVELDVIEFTPPVNNTFSGISQSTGRTLSGSIVGSGFSVSYGDRNYLIPYSSQYAGET